MLAWGFPRTILFTALLFLGCPVLTAQASPDPQYSADVMLKIGSRPSSVCGTASAAGGRARLDIKTSKAGVFFLVVDTAAGTMRVASERLKAYVEVPVSGDPLDWRDLVRSAAAVVAPQSLGMIDVRETDRRNKGRTVLRGYTAKRSSSTFEILFMGKSRRYQVEVWENDFFAPFPMQAASAETKETWPGKAWLTRVTADEHEPGYFEIPSGYTRYASVMELILYALANF